MDENKMRNERPFYVKNAQHLDGIRPLCHAASAITTAMFVVVLLLRQDFAMWFIERAGNWSHVIAFGIVLYPVVILEQKISYLIDDFAHSIATLHSWRMAGLMGLIVLPFIILSGATSFVGTSETAHQGANFYQSQQLATLSKSLESSSDELNISREDALRNQRKEQRNLIAQKHESQLSKVDQTNKARFKEYKTNEWHFQKLREYNLRDSARIEKLMHSELESFDKETTKAIANLMDNHNSIKKSETITKAVLVENTTDVIVEKSDRLKWLGGFFGLVAVILLIISTLAAIGSNFLKTKFNITEAEMKGKKKVKTESVNVKTNHYPIDANKQKSNHFETKKPENKPYGVHNSGVGDDTDKEILKNRLRETVKNLEKGTGFEQTETLKHSIAIIDELEKNHGVIASIGADGKAIFEAK